MKKAMAWMLVLALMLGVSNAALLGNWLDPNAVFVNDTAQDENSGGGACDILQIGYVQQGGYYYFLMTTRAIPSASTFSEGYMLNFDFTLGGANANNSYYVATGLVGIDLMIDSHYFQDFKVSNHWHPYDAGEAPLFGTENGLAAPYNILYNTAMNGTDWIQEWAVPISLLPANTDFTLWGSTLNPSVGGKVTYDVTGSLSFETIPEPTSLALLALGVAAIGLRRRFRK